MKFCKEHWEQLRQTIIDKGMMNLVSNSGQEAMSEMVAELKDEAHKYDPLMAAHNMITAAALEAGGLYIMTVDEDDNHYCPLCEVKENMGEEMVKDWIDGSTDACLEYSKANGLLNLN